MFSQKYSYTSDKILNTPKLFAPGIISTELDELNACFTPDGKTLFYCLNAIGNKYAVIMMTEFKNGKWTIPQIAPFSTGLDSDYDPFISPDGERLFFISNRLYKEGNYARKNFDIYYVDKINGIWNGKIKNMGSVINDARDQYYPSVSKNGNLYYSTIKDSSFDIYCSKYENGNYTTPQKLAGSLNTGTHEIDNCISPDEDFIIFSGYGRKDSKGSGDLYISFNINGSWSEAINLGETINTNSKEYCPILSPDGSYLFYTSTSGIFDSDLKSPLQSYAELKKALNGILNGLGNIYQVPFDKKIVQSFQNKLVQKN